MIQIGVHLIGEELDQHIIRLASQVSRMTIVCEVPTKLKLAPAPRMKSWPLEIVRLDRHPGLPHSPSNKQPRSREGQFNKVVTGLLELPGHINPTCSHYKSKLVHRGLNNAVLNRHSRGLPPWNIKIATALSPPFPSE
jgi:hypothetical protein